MSVVLITHCSLRGDRGETSTTVMGREGVSPEGWNMSVINTRYKARAG